MDVKLVVVGGDVKASEIKIKLPAVLGRGREASLTLAHPLVSRLHCRIFENAGKLMVKDLGSLNGTFVNNQKIDGEAELPSGQLLTVGTVTFRAVYGPAATEVMPPKAETSSQTAAKKPGTETVRAPSGQTVRVPKGESKPAAPPAAAPPPAAAAEDPLDFLGMFEEGPATEAGIAEAADDGLMFEINTESPASDAGVKQRAPAPAVPPAKAVAPPPSKSAPPVEEETPVAASSPVISPTDEEIASLDFDAEVPPNEAAAQAPEALVASVEVPSVPPPVASGDDFAVEILESFEEVSDEAPAAAPPMPTEVAEVVEVASAAPAAEKPKGSVQPAATTHDPFDATIAFTERPKSASTPAATPPTAPESGKPSSTKPAAASPAPTANPSDPFPMIEEPAETAEEPVADEDLASFFRNLQG